MRPRIGFRFFTAAAAFAAALALSSCGVSCSAVGAEQKRPLSILSYNVLSLFDPVDDGTEYSDFSVAKGSWDEARYRRRLDNLAKVALEGTKGSVTTAGPDILCLVEVEDRRVLEDLRDGPLKSAGYRYIAISPAPGAAINTGLLSRIPIASLAAHAISGTSISRGRRNILEAVLEVDGARLGLLVCHWKSKLEGAEATEEERREAAALVASRVTALIAADPDIGIVVCGDFNENPDEYVRVGRRYATALMPEAEARVPAGERLLIAPGAGETGFRGGEPVLYSPWAESDGFSYAYKGERERIDGFLISTTLLLGGKLRYRSFSVVDAPFLLDSSGAPLPWSSYSGVGYSDHLPILLTLERAGPAQSSTSR